MAPRPRSAVPWVLASAVVFAALGCGPSTGSVGSSHARRPDGAVVLHLRTTDGRTLATEDQRGSPMLLVVLATYDGVCQAAMRPLSRYARHHEEMLVVGVLAQPDAATFAPLFERAMEAPFAITWDPSESITRGVSDLGPLDAVPTYYQLDAEGRIRERHVGFLDEHDLERFME